MPCAQVTTISRLLRDTAPLLSMKRGQPTAVRASVPLLRQCQQKLVATLPLLRPSLVRRSSTSSLAMLAVLVHSAPRR